MEFLSGEVEVAARARRRGLLSLADVEARVILSDVEGLEALGAALAAAPAAGADARRVWVAANVALLRDASAVARGAYAEVLAGEVGAAVLGGGRGDEAGLDAGDMVAVGALLSSRAGAWAARDVPGDDDLSDEEEEGGAAAAGAGGDVGSEALCTSMVALRCARVLLLGAAALSLYVQVRPPPCCVRLCVCVCVCVCVCELVIVLACFVSLCLRIHVCVCACVCMLVHFLRVGV
jgi:hypothetical protein